MRKKQEIIQILILSPFYFILSVKERAELVKRIEKYATRALQ